MSLGLLCQLSTGVNFYECQLTSGLHFSGKQGANKTSSKVEKAVTESNLHRKESFQQVDKSVFEEVIQTCLLYFGEIETRIKILSMMMIMFSSIVFFMGAWLKVVFINVHCAMLALLIITLIRPTLISLFNST